MKFQCSRDYLVEGISYVQKAIANRTTISILSGILFEVDHNIKLTGYDMEQSIEYTFPADIKSPGKVVIDASFLGEMIRRCTEDTIYVDCDDQQNIEITCGKAVFQFKGINAESYPKLPEVDKDTSFNLSGKELKKIIKQTIFAISDDQSRRNLMGCFFNIKENCIDIVGIDGFRMALRRSYAPENVKYPTKQFIVLGKHLKDLMAILDEDSMVEISVGQSQIIFDFGRIRMISRLIQEHFLNYESIIPAQFKTRLVVNTKELLAGMERSLLISSAERKYPVNLMTQGNLLKIFANSNRGKMEEDIDIELSGEKMNMDLNPRYVIEVLKSIEEESFVMRLSGDLSPLVFLPMEGDEYLYIVLPLRK